MKISKEAKEWLISFINKTIIEHSNMEKGFLEKRDFSKEDKFIVSGFLAVHDIYESKGRVLNKMIDTFEVI